jgi:LmbE family N-acetylglucosaminyl deacetylase
MKNFLVISPHPDDIDFMCAGTIAKLVAQGNTVQELIVSDGCKGNHVVGYGGKKLAAQREKEQKAAADVLGVSHVYFMREKDGELENTKQLRKKLVEQIRKLKPNVVISFDPAHANFQNMYASHRDHRQVAEAVFDALYPAVGNSSFFPELLAKGVMPHQVQECWFFGADKPNTVVSITKTREQKVKALECHKSQIPSHDWLKKVMQKQTTESFRVLQLA